MKKPIVWMDGSCDAAPPGKLLSNNLEFFGDVIPTGMTYTYLTPLSGIGDTDMDHALFVGRRLLDGRLERRYGKEPAMASGELSVLFTLNQTYTIKELDLFLPSEFSEITLYGKSRQETFTLWHRQSMTDSHPLRRLRIEPREADQIRLTIRAVGILELFQVWIWGDGITDETVYKNEGNHFEYANSIAMESLMGARRTAFSDVEGFHWMKRLKKTGQFAAGAVWSECPAYGDLTSCPLLPEPEQINRTIYRRLCRNGSEVVCVALTNTDSTSPRDVTVALENPSPLQIEWMAIGILPSRWYGMSASVLLNTEHTITRPLLYRYVANAPVIADFPLIHLPAGGSCLFWVRLTAADCPAGEWDIRLTAGSSVQLLRARVLSQKLPEPHTGILLYGDGTTMYPFVYQDRTHREVQYRKAIGTHIYIGWPKPNTVEWTAMVEDPQSQFLIDVLGRFTDLLYLNRLTAEDFTKSLEEEVYSLLQAAIDQANSLQLGFDRWFVSLTDEPGRHNMSHVETFVRMIKRFCPQIRIFLNPAFWTGFENDGVEQDETITRCLEGWYDTLVDISMPLALNLEDRPNSLRYFRSQREYNGQYWVSGQHMSADRKELISLPRACAWDSIARDMNWWGFYSYYCPRLNSWDNGVCPEKDEDATINYQCVYPGTYGPVPTRASEAIREGYQDACIMSLLAKSDPALHRHLQKQYLSHSASFEELHRAMLDALEKMDE